MDVGEFPSYMPTDIDPGDPERPTRLLAHAIARGADRVAPLRKISRHLEGTESKSGILSDLTAAAFDLYARNTDEIESLLAQYMGQVKVKAERRRAAARQKHEQRPTGVTQ